MRKSVLLSVCVICIVAVFLLILPFLLFVLSLRGMSENTVVMTLESPEGGYFVQVIDNDQGALGGATIVEVYESQSFLGRHKKVSRVYTGEWGEYRTMEIYWKDEHCLVINAVEYRIE